jgi:hypothetical protein
MPKTQKSRDYAVLFALQFKNTTIHTRFGAVRAISIETVNGGWYIEKNATRITDLVMVEKETLSAERLNLINLFQIGDYDLYKIGRIGLYE